jgi:hypothetical protein
MVSANSEEKSSPWAPPDKESLFSTRSTGAVPFRLSSRAKRYTGLLLRRSQFRPRWRLVPTGRGSA